MPDLTALTAYEVRNLVAHLEAAHRDHDVHRLLALEEGSDVNSWLRVKSTHGDWTDYLDDLRRAGRMARAAVDEAIRADRTSVDVALEIRYVLLEASFRSQAQTLPVPLLVASLKRGIWSAEAALSFLRMPGLRSEVIATLVPHLPPGSRHAFVRAALDELRAGGATAVGRALTDLGQYVPPDLATDLLDVVATIDDRQLRAEALVALRPALPAELTSRAVAMAREIHEPQWRALALAGLGKPLSVAAFHEAFKAVAPRDDDTPWDQAQLIVALAPHLTPELHGEALSATHHLAGHRSHAVVALAPHLPTDLLPAALEIAQTFTEPHACADVIVALAPQLTTALLRPALAIARRITGSFGEAPRAKALCALAQRLPDGEGHLTLGYRTLRPTRQSVLREALAAAEKIHFTFSHDGVDIVATMATLLPDRLLPRVLRLARSLSPDDAVPIMAATGARMREPRRSRVLAEALRASRHMRPDRKVLALRLLAPHLPADVLTEIRTAPSLTHGNDTRTNEQLGEIAPFLSANDLSTALRFARRPRDTREHCAVVAALAPYLDDAMRADHCHSLLTAIPQLETTWDQALALGALAPHLPDHLFPTAFGIAKDIKYEQSARAIAELAPHTPRRHLPEMIAAARASEPTNAKPSALAALAAQVAEPDRSTLFAEALDAATSVDEDMYGVPNITVVFDVAAELPASLLPRALSIARAITDDTQRAKTLAALAGRLPADQRAMVLDEALSAARSVHFERSRASALVQVGATVPAVVDAAQKLPDTWWRGHALVQLGQADAADFLHWAIDALPHSSDDIHLHSLLTLLPYAPVDTARATLLAITSVHDNAAPDHLPSWQEKWASHELPKVVMHLAEDVLPQLLALTATLHPTHRAQTLSSIATRFRDCPIATLTQLWTQARATLNTADRKSTLAAVTDLVPVIVLFGTDAAAVEVAEAIRDVTRWVEIH